MSVVLARVDNRLIHGQVLEAWIPRLDAGIVIVVDDGIAGDPLRQTIMEIAVPSQINCRFVSVDALKETLDAVNVPNQRVVVLFSGIKDVRDTLRMGVPIDRINIGNVHYQRGKKRVTQYVSLDEDEIHWLMEIERRAQVEIQALPDDTPLRFPDLLEGGDGSGPLQLEKRRWWERWREWFHIKRDLPQKRV